jgi:hypothetical protein
VTVPTIWPSMKLPRRHRRGVGQRQKRNPPHRREERRRGGGADEQPVRGHAAEPERRHVLRMCAIERPLVERDLHAPAAGQHADRHQYRQRPGGPPRQPEPRVVAHDDAVQVQEPEREAGAVPPQVKAADVGEHRVEPMDVAAGHGPPFRGGGPEPEGPRPRRVTLG